MKRTAAKHRSEEMCNHPSQTVYLPVLIIPDVRIIVKLDINNPPEKREDRGCFRQFKSARRQAHSIHPSIWERRTAGAIGFIYAPLIIQQRWLFVKPEKENVLYVAQNAGFPRHSADDCFFAFSHWLEGSVTPLKITRRIFLIKRTAAKHRSEEMYNHPSQTVYLPVLIIPDVVAFVKLYMKKAVLSHGLSCFAW